MKIVKCMECGGGEERDAAVHEGWKVEDKFDENIYGFWGICPDCQKAEKTPVQKMEDFIEYQKQYTTFGRHHYPVLKKLLGDIKRDYIHKSKFKVKLSPAHGQGLIKRGDDFRKEARQNFLGRFALPHNFGKDIILFSFGAHG